MNVKESGNDMAVSLKNLWVKEKGQLYKNDIRNLVEDLDSLPFPDFTIYGRYKFFFSFLRERYPIITGRGCSYNCSFCYNDSLRKVYKGKGVYIRRRSVRNVIAELLEAKVKYKVQKFIFVDDDFAIDAQWLEIFSGEYRKKIRLPFICDVCASSITDKKMAILKKGGCICVKMGVETGNEYIRKVILNKDITNRRIKEAAFLIKKYNIGLKTCNILGIPGETAGNALETLEFNKEISSDFVLCSLLQPYPGTRIADYAKQNNVLGGKTSQKSLKFDESCYAGSCIKLENEREIINLQRLIQFFIKLHAPMFLVKFLVKAPQNKLYYWIFKLNFAYGIYKTEKLKLISCVRFALHVKSYV